MSAPSVLIRTMALLTLDRQEPRSGQARSEGEKGDIVCRLCNRRSVVVTPNRTKPCSPGRRLDDRKKLSSLRCGGFLRGGNMLMSSRSNQGGRKVGIPRTETRWKRRKKSRREPSSISGKERNNTRPRCAFLSSSSTTSTSTSNCSMVVKARTNDRTAGTVHRTCLPPEPLAKFLPPLGWFPAPVPAPVLVLVLVPVPVQMPVSCLPVSVRLTLNIVAAFYKVPPQILRLPHRACLANPPMISTSTSLPLRPSASLLSPSHLSLFRSLQQFQLPGNPSLLRQTIHSRGVRSRGILVCLRI